MKGEPEIYINGKNLGPGCAMTLRVAIEAFASYLKDKENRIAVGEDLCLAYRARIDDIRKAIYDK